MNKDIVSGNKAIERIVKGFTKGLLGRKSTRSQCYVVGLPLGAYLHFLGYENELVEGELHFENGIHHHWWIEFKDGTIADPTADQFNEYAPIDKRLPRYYVGKKPEWYNNQKLKQKQP